MKKALFISWFITALIACNNHTVTETNPGETTKKDSAEATPDTSGFFPVAAFIGGEIKTIDSFQLPLTKTITINNKPKVFPVSDEEFRALAKNFTEPDVNSPELAKHYTKSNIADESIPSITLSFTANDNTVPVRKVDVYVKPDPASTDKVSAIYIEKSFTSGDTIVNQRLYWKAGRNMQITTEKIINNKTLPLQQVKVVWDPND